MATFKFNNNGTVQITIYHGKTFDGKARRFYKTVPSGTKKYLEKEAALFLAEILQGDASIASTATVNAVFKDFLSHHTELQESTLSRYRVLYKNQIEPFLGKRKINSITKPDIRSWINVLAEKGNKTTGEGLSPKTIKHALSLLSTVYNYAMYDLEIIDKNPCIKIKVPKFEKAVVKEFYSEEELLELLVLLDEKLDDPRSITHATLLYLILFTGMRTGEVMGLRWHNVDFENRTITIEEERIYSSEAGIIHGTTKTESSRRTISVPEFIMAMLRRLQLHQENLQVLKQEEFTYTGYVAIVPDTGLPQEPRNTYKWFKRFLKRNNLKDCTVHDLRHTHAAMLSSMGVSMLNISKRLGHSNTRITQEVYEYLFKDVGDSISVELDTYFKKITVK